MKNCKLYVILDKELAGKKDILKIAKDALRGGADIVQLRDKISSDSTLIEEAKALRELVKRYKKLFIINDRADIARIVDADGVHLGQEDIPIKDARKILPRKIIGISTHNLAEALKAQKSGADYIGIGPVFRTTSKPRSKPLGTAVLKTIKRNIDIPFFVIGGIKLHNLRCLKKIGINKIAVISAVTNAKDVQSSTLLLKRELGKRVEPLGLKPEAPSSKGIKVTLLESAKKGVLTEKMRLAAKYENVDPAYIRDGIANGSIVIPSNRSRKISKYCAIGKGLRTKVNANIGSSAGCEDVDLELKKLDVAIEAGADTVMDLSTGENLKKIRHLILKKSGVPVGTVPIYEMAVEKISKGRDIANISKNDMLKCIENQAKEGVDFFTVHCGVTKESLKKMAEEGRLLDIVSRGGALITQWIAKTGEENLFYEFYDDILEIAHEYDIALSLGDGMRPGCIKDATDRAQITELITLGQLAKRGKRAGVQIMIEGPGHVPIHQIKRNVEIEKSLCDNAPFYVLGPIVTDIAPGYDHITSAIGGALAGSFGADFLCYVTPSEHLRLPTLEDVREGVIAARIAAHAADLAKGVKGAIDKDNAISTARKKRDWKKQIECSIDPKKAGEYRRTSNPISDDVCTMCNKYCSIKLFEEAASSGKKP